MKKTANYLFSRGGCGKVIFRFRALFYYTFIMFRLVNIEAITMATNRSFYPLCLMTSIVMMSPGQSVAEPLKAVTLGSGISAYIENHKATGPLYELQNLILDTAGLDYVNSVVPFKRISVMAQQSKFDITIASYPDETWIDMLPISLLFSTQVIIIANKDISLSEPEKLYGKKLAILRGSNLAFSQRHSQIQRVEVNSHIQGVKMLTKGRVDAILGSLYGLSNNFSELALNPKDYSAPLTLLKKEYWLLYNKVSYDESVSRKLKQAVERLRLNGEFERLHLRFNPGLRHPGVTVNSSE